MTYQQAVRAMNQKHHVWHTFKSLCGQVVIEGMMRVPPSIQLARNRNYLDYPVDRVRVKTVYKNGTAYVVGDSFAFRAPLADLTRYKPRRPIPIHATTPT